MKWGSKRMKTGRKKREERRQRGRRREVGRDHPWRICVEGERESLIRHQMGKILGTYVKEGRAATSHPTFGVETTIILDPYQSKP